MNTKTTALVVATILALAGLSGLYYFGGDRESAQDAADTSEESVVPTPTSTNTEGAPSVSPVTVVPVTHEISIESSAYSTKTVTIKKGDTVTWINRDSAPHTVTGDAGGPLSDTIQRFGVYSYTFTDAGTFPYHCKFHSSMTGTVVVTE